MYPILSTNHRCSVLDIYCVEKARQKDAEEILEFLLTNFILNEPLNVAAGITREKSANLCKIAQFTLDDGLSYIVRDPANENQVIGVRLANKIHRPRMKDTVYNNVNRKSNLQNGNSLEKIDRNDEKRKGSPISILLLMVYSKIWELVPMDVDALLYWLIVSVNNEFQRRGIAHALLSYNLDEARKMGCRGAVTEATSLNSQKLFSKLGYSRLYELLHSDFKDDQGEQVFRCKDGTDRVTLEFKPFN